MRVLALAALVAVAMATDPAPDCRSNRGCVRHQEYCAKNDNADGTQRFGHCTALPRAGERCGSARDGLTTKCADGLTCNNGCCGGVCGSTVSPSTAAAGSTAAAASTAAAGSTAAASTRAPGTTMAPRK